MSKTLTAKFLTRYPGPFAYHDGSDGVDATFDVSCLKTSQHITSTYYWDDRLPCELEARVITELLNSLLGSSKDYLRPYPHHLSEREIAAFRGMHAGPYRSAKCKCDYRGNGYQVLSETTGDCVIYVYDRTFRGQARLVTAVIAELLNAMQ